MHPVLKKVRFLIIPLFLAGLFGCPDPSTGWVWEAVSTAEDGGEDVGMNSSLVVDSEGRVHIAYRDSDDWVRYVRRGADGVWSGWSYTDPTDATSGKGVSVAVDNTNVYVTSTLSGDTYSSSGDLVLASRPLDAEVPDSGLWPAGTVVNIDDVSDWSSLVAGGDGTLHLLYKDDGSLRYRQRSAGATSFGSASTIESYSWVLIMATAISGHGSLVVANDKVHAVYKTRTALLNGDVTEKIKYASRNSDGSGSWEKKTVASGGVDEEFGDIMDVAVDSSGGVHIGFVNKTDDRMVYARRLTGEPSFSLYEGGPDPSGWDWVDGCQILTLGDKVYAFFRADVDPGTSADVKPFLMMASRDVDAGMTSSWVTSFIDSGIGVFGAEQKTFSAASDSFNRIHVAYETCGNPDCTDSDLKYACAAMADTACLLSEELIPPPACDGDGVCDAGETAEDCPADCAPAGSVCGDGVCAEDEGAACPADCGAAGPVCGDAACDPGEDSTTCTLDCGSEGGSTDAATDDDVATEQDNGSSASNDSPVPSGDVGSAEDNDAPTGWSAEGVTVEAVGGGGCSLIPR